MKIKILFFGILTDITGKEEMHLADVKSTNELINKLHAVYPGMNNLTYRIAVNREMVVDNTELKDGDEVALLPPFAGG